MTIFGSTRMIALALAGASVIALATPADAAWRGRTAAAAGIGFAAGALIGGAVAASAQPRAYYGDGYAYSPYQSYGYYQPAPTYYDPAPTYYETAPTYYAPYGYAPYSPARYHSGYSRYTTELYGNN